MITELEIILDNNDRAYVWYEPNTTLKYDWNGFITHALKETFGFVKDIKVKTPMIIPDKSLFNKEEMVIHMRPQLIEPEIYIFQFCFNIYFDQSVTKSFRSQIIVEEFNICNISDWYNFTTKELEDEVRSINFY